MLDQRDDGGFLGQPAWLWSVAALVVGLSLAVLAALLHHTELAKAERDQFEHRAERSFDAVEMQLKSCGLLVRSVQALFMASDEVTDREFDNIYANLRPRELFPSLQAIAYAERVTTGASAEDPVPREHFITRLVAPKLGNERLFGLDVAAQPANLKRDDDRPDEPRAPFLLVDRRRPR